MIAVGIFVPDSTSLGHRRVRVDPQTSIHALHRSRLIRVILAGDQKNPLVEATNNWNFWLCLLLLLLLRLLLLLLLAGLLLLLLRLWRGLLRATRRLLGLHRLGNSLGRLRLLSLGLVRSAALGRLHSAGLLRILAIVLRLSIWLRCCIPLRLGLGRRPLVLTARGGSLLEEYLLLLLLLIIILVVSVHCVGQHLLVLDSYAFLRWRHHGVTQRYVSIHDKCVIHRWWNRPDLLLLILAVDLGSQGGLLSIAYSVILPISSIVVGGPESGACVSAPDHLSWIGDAIMLPHEHLLGLLRRAILRQHCISCLLMLSLLLNPVLLRVILPLMLQFQPFLGTTWYLLLSLCVELLLLLLLRGLHLSISVIWIVIQGWFGLPL